MLARQNLVNIPAEEAQEKVDRTVGVSDIVVVSVAVQVTLFTDFFNKQQCQ